MLKLIYLSLFFSFSVAASVELQFDDLRSYLETRNGEVEASRLSVQAAENRQGYLRRKFTPTLNLEGGVENFSTGPYNDLTQPYGAAVVNMNLFNGYKDSFNQRMIQTEMAQKKTEYDQKLMDELFKLRKLYWEYLYEKEVIEILTMASEMNQKNLGSAKVRINNGIATMTDQIEFEQNGLQVSQDLNRSKIELINREREIKAVIGLAGEEGIASSETIPHEHQDNLMAEEFRVDEHRNNLWLNYERVLMDNQRKISRNWWTPSLDIYAGASHFTQKDRDYFSYSERNDLTLGVKVSMNLFDGGESYNQSKTLYLRTSAVEKEAQQVRRELGADYLNAKSLLELTHSQIHNAEDNVKKSEQYYKNTLNEYGRGIKNSPDVLQASQRLVNARLRLIELKKDYQVSRSSLLFSLGR